MNWNKVAAVTAGAVIGTGVHYGYNPPDPEHTGTVDFIGSRAFAAGNAAARLIFDTGYGLRYGDDVPGAADNIRMAATGVSTGLKMIVIGALLGDSRFMTEEEEVSETEMRSASETETRAASRDPVAVLPIKAVRSVIGSEFKDNSFGVVRTNFNMDGLKAVPGAAPATLEQVLGNGMTPMEPQNGACKEAFERFKKRAPGLADGATNFCWSEQQLGKRWKPQGIDTSGTTVGLKIAGKPANQRNLIMISWYSSLPETGQVSKRSGKDVNRLTIVDLDRKVQRNIELAKLCGKKLCAFNEHAGGVAWFGDKVAVPGKFGFSMFDFSKDLRLIHGKFVLVRSGVTFSPKAEKDNVGIGDTVMVDRSVVPNRINSAAYLRVGKTNVFTWHMNRSGTDFDFPAREAGSNKPLSPSQSVIPVDKNRFQGVGSYKNRNIAVGGGKIHVWQSGKTVNTRQLMHGTPESMAINLRTNKVVIPTENDPAGMGDDNLRTYQVVSIPLKNVVQ